MLIAAGEQEGADAGESLLYSSSQRCHVLIQSSQLMRLQHRVHQRLRQHALKEPRYTSA